MIKLPETFFLVIPGCAPRRRPGIHNHDRGYEFRVRAEAARPGMTVYPWIACQTRSGDAGIARLLLPIASVIALITAADAPIAPASPQPFTPRGLPGHSVSVVETLNDGRSSARGIA